MTLLLDRIRRHPSQETATISTPQPTTFEIPQCLQDIKFLQIPNTQWYTAMVLVTPLLAEQMLTANIDNRKLRRQTVGKYSATMTAGNWVPSPESICFDVNGRVINGQHRLHGVVNSGTSQYFMIVLNVETAVFTVLDRNAVRTPADALKLPPKLAQVARVVVAIIAPPSSNAGILDQDIKLVADMMIDEHDILMTKGSTSNCKLVSSAPVRAAACLRLLEGQDPEYVTSTYRNMVLRKYHEIPPIACAFMQQINNNKLSSSGTANQRDLLIRAMDVFNPKSATKARLQVNSVEARTQEVREIIEAAYVT